MKLTMFREGGPDAPVSMRRVLAFLSGLTGFVSGILTIKFISIGWWVALIPTLFIGAMLLLLFFTTWADIVAIIHAMKGKEE